MKQETIIVCERIGDGEPKSPFELGAGKCSECGVPVIADKSNVELAERGEATLICTSCAAPLLTSANLGGVMIKGKAHSMEVALILLEPFIDPHKNN